MKTLTIFLIVLILWYSIMLWYLDISLKELELDLHGLLIFGACAITFLVVKLKKETEDYE